MNPQDPSSGNPSEQTAVDNPLKAMRPGEKTIFAVKRHPIGMLITYTISGLVLLAIGVILLVVLPSLLPDYKNTIRSVGTAIFGLSALIMLILAFIANIVYWGNSWVLTSDSLTQIKQTSLFDKQSSQLSLANLEDVTAEQNGILTHMFNYGVVKAETAGERSKFMFLYCPNPSSYAQKILEAREEFEQAGHSPAAPAASPVPPANIPPRT